MVTKTEALPYRDEEAALTGFLAWDDASAGELPGILVVHGGGGLDDHAKDQARRYAALGFVVLACDMFGDGVAGDRERVMATVIGLRDDPQRMSQRALAGLAALAARPQVDGRLAAIGFCFGGMAVLTLARAGADLAGAVSIHGSLATPRPAEAGSIRARVLVCQGALDPHVPMAQVTAFIDEMNQAGADWQMNIYGGAMHGFTHKNAVAGATPGVAYDALTDQRSFDATRGFLADLFPGGRANLMERTAIRGVSNTPS
jgi:dienelactone hydrolase